MPRSKDPRITVHVSADLLAQLLNADTALKNSRMNPERKKAGALHALIVQCTSARSKVPVVNDSFVARPEAPLPEAPAPGSVKFTWDELAAHLSHEQPLTVTPPNPLEFDEVQTVDPGSERFLVGGETPK